MSLPPPDWSALWGDIVTHHPAIQWPLVDAGELKRLAKDWGRLGNELLSGDYKYGEAELLHAWTGEAGREYQRRMDEAKRNAREAGHMGLDMQSLVRMFHNTVGTSTNEIWDLMEKHEEFYLDLTWSLFAWFHPEEAGREAEKYRTKIAGEVSLILHTALSHYKSDVEWLDAQAASRG
jgi:hypothetical protein